MSFSKKVLICGVSVLAIAGCSDDISYVQKDSPANPYKDYDQSNGASVIGVGEPISKRQMKANATIDMRGRMSLDTVMRRMASTYNVAVRWAGGVRKNKIEDVIISDLDFNEARSYIEDVFDIQIVREGERRLLVMTSASEKRLEEFSPGIGVSLSQAVRGLAAQCDYNVVISENKQQLAGTSVTTSLKNVTCYDAFQALLSPHGLSLADRGDYYEIANLPQRQWSLNLYEPVREEEVEVAYESEIEASEDSGGTQSVGGKAKVTVSYERDLWAELEKDLNELVDKSCESSEGGDAMAAFSANQAPTLLPAPSLEGEGAESASASQSLPLAAGTVECGYVRINKSVGMVQMRAPQDVLDKADEIIRRVEDIAGRRLLVEARVLAVTRTREFEQGGSLQAGGEEDDIMHGITSSPRINTIAGTITGRLQSFGTTRGGFLWSKAGGLDAVVRMVEEYGTTYQLMNPTIEVMDRQRATLIDGRNERYFVREIERETDDSGNILRSLSATEKSQFVGLQFSVSAQIAEEDDAHTISLQIPITEISRFITLSQVFDNDTIEDAIPIATTRLIDQKVRIRDGEVKVIGGLTRTIAIDRESGVPLIRGVPAFGKLFDEEDISYENAEFIVLLQVKRLY